MGGFLSNLRKTSEAEALPVSLDERGPSKADPDSFKSFQHTRHPLGVKFVGGIDYRVGSLFAFLRRMYEGHV